MDDRPTSRRRFLFGAASTGTVAIATLAGCLGDDEGDDAETEVSDDDTNSDDAGDDDVPADDDTGDSDDAGDDVDEEFDDLTGEAVVEVETRRGEDDEPDFVFDPAFVTVDAGTTIEWVNTDGVFHTVTSTDDIDSRSGGGDEFDATISSEGDSFEWDADDPGLQPYYCSPHAGFMYGAIEIV